VAAADRCVATALEGCPRTRRILGISAASAGTLDRCGPADGHVIIVLEFKVGATSISVLDRQQTEDYALDLF
jgi:hypothetical protein